MEKVITLLKDPTKRASHIQIASIALSALFLGSGLSFFMSQKPHIHQVEEPIKDSSAITRHISPTPTQGNKVIVTNDKQLMIELISENLSTIQTAEGLINRSKNTDLITAAQDVVNTLKKENNTFTTWLSNKYDIQYNPGTKTLNPTTAPTGTVLEQEKAFKAYMTKYFGLSTNMIMQVQDKEIPEDIDKYLEEVIEVRKKQFFALEKVVLVEAILPVSISPKR